MEYDPIQKNLVVSFVSGMVYVYKEVPETVYVAMKTSGAKGIYLNRNIKGKYEYEKIDKPIDPR
jgi:hypothetical protein